MGTNGDDDLFDDLADSFFRQGDAGVDDFWADDEPVTPEPEPEPEPEVAPEPAPRAVDVAPPAPTVVAEAAPPMPEPPAPPPTPEPAAPTPEPAAPPTPDPEPAPETQPAPAASESDRAFFSAPTMILPAGQPLGPEPDPEPAPPVTPPPVEALPTPSAPAAPEPPAPVTAGLAPQQEETLFDTGFEADFFGDLGSAEPTAEVLDAPTQEVSREEAEAMLRDLSAPAPVEPVAEAAEPVDDDDYEDDDLEEASADDFVDELGPDPSLVLRRPLSPAPPRALDVPQEPAAPPPVVPTVAAAAPVAPPPVVPAAAAEPTPPAPVAAPEPAEDAPVQVPEDPAPVTQSLGAGPVLDASASSVEPTTFQGPRAVAPAEGAEAWSSLVDDLLAAAASAEADASAHLLSEAGRVVLHKLGDAERASSLLARAVAGGAEDTATLAAYTEAAGAVGDHERIRDLLLRRAGQATDAEAARLLQDAALVERHQLRRPQAAADLLRRSIEATAGGGHNAVAWFGRHLLADTLKADQRWQDHAGVLEEMASSTTDNAVKSDVLSEAGRIYEARTEDHEAAARCYLGAIEAGCSDPTVVVGAERCLVKQGDPTRLGQLFESLAGRTTGTDAALWLVRAARAASDADEADRAVALWTAASAHGLPTHLLLELHNLLERQERWSDLHQQLRAASESADRDTAQWFRSQAAEVAEVHLDAATALEDWRATAAIAPGHGPATDGELRTLARSNNGADVVALLEDQLESAEDAGARVALRTRIAELAEGHLDDLDRAASTWQAILDEAPGYLPAIDGLVRVAGRQGEATALVAAMNRAAEADADGVFTTSWTTRAAELMERSGGASEEVWALYTRALDADPGDRIALEGLERLAHGNTDATAELATRLQSAAQATDSVSRQVSLWYREAVLRADVLDDADGARVALEKVQQASPGFRPAAERLRAAAYGSGHGPSIAALEEQASASESSDTSRLWRLLGAARASRGTEGEARIVQSLLRSHRDNAPVRLAAEQLAIASGDLTARRTLLEDTGRTQTQPLAFVLAADLAAAIGDSEAAASALESALDQGVVSEAPSFCVALAVRVGDGGVAVRAAEAGDQGVAAARLRELHQADTAESAWSVVADVAPVAAAHAALRQANRSADRDGVAAAHDALSMAISDGEVAAVHAVLAGHLHAAAARPDAAQEAYTRGNQQATERGRAFDGLLRLDVDSGDAAAVTARVEAVGERWAGELAELLEEAGAPNEALSRWSALADADRTEAQQLSIQGRIERLALATEDWAGALAALKRQAELTADPALRDSHLARQRWLLAEKLADTEEAWSEYQRLHSEDPSNADVLEALARIAGARGETDLALGYLDGLVQVADEPVVRARYLRRIAEVRVGSGDSAGARAALDQALEADPGNPDTLGDLRQLAGDSEDWSTLVGVLSSQAAVMEGEDRVGALRQVARIWEGKLHDRGVALDAWRKVLDAAPGDTEAEDHILAIARDAEDWSTFAELAPSVIARTERPAQAELQTELGRVLLRHLYRQPDAIAQLSAAATGEGASADAGAELERLHVAAGRWDEAIQAMELQARASEPARGVELLTRAARTTLDMRGDRDAAAALYGKVLALDADNSVALTFLADHHYQAGRMEEAASVFERLEPSFDDLDLDDDEDIVLDVTLALYRHAVVLQKLDRVDDAIARYERVREINPSHLPSLEGVGPLYIARERWADAGSVYRHLLRLTGGQGDPGRLARTYTNLGRVELELGNIDKAERRFAKALQVRPNDIEALLGSADVLLKRGDDQEGEQQSETWRRLLTVYNNIIYHAQTPDEVVRAYLTKGFVLDARLGLPDKARQHYAKSLSFNSDQPEVLLRLAELALRQQDWPEAENLASKGLALDKATNEQRAGLHLARYVAFAACADEQAASTEYAAALATETAFVGQLPDAPVGPGPVRERLQHHIQASL